MLRFGLRASTALSLILFGASSVSAQDVIDIPAQPLADALVELGNETGLQVMAPTDAIEGKRSTAVSGSMTPQAALRLMLLDTGLSVQTPERNAAILRFSENVVSQNAADEPFDLGTLVLQGELIDRDVQDSQTSAVVITGEQLESRGVPDLREVLERTPGVTNSNDAREVAIRGIRDRGPNAQRGNSLLVSTVIDGAPISNFPALRRGSPSLWDLEAVEILRGPQSTQSGRNALAGSIILRSRDPEYFREFKLRGEVAEFDTYGGALAFNFPLIEDRLALRFSAESLRNEGAIRNITTGADDAGRENSDTYRLGLRWDPTDQLSAVFKYTRYEGEFGDPLVDLTRFPGERVVTFNDPSDTELESDIFSLLVGYDFTPNLRMEFDATYFEGTQLRRFDADETEAAGGSFVSPRNHKDTKLELRLSYDSDRIKAVGGLFYNTYKRDQSTIGSFGALTFTSTSNPDVENAAIFGEVEYRLNPSIRLIGGLRYDTESFTQIDDTIINGVGDPVALEGDYDAFLPKLGIVYDFSETQSLGFTIQRGYRAGGAVNSITFGVLPFEPEFTTNYELAYRSEFGDGLFVLNANVFYTRFTDQQVGRGDTIQDFRIVNAGESEVYGAEVQFEGQMTDSLDVFASAAYAHTEFLNFVDGGQDFGSNSFPDAPELTLAFGGTYNFNNGWYVGADASYTDSAFGDAANDPALKSDSRFLVNARVGYRADTWEAFAYVNNAFDENYVTSRIAGGARGRVGDPMTIGAVLQATF